MAALKELRFNGSVSRRRSVTSGVPQPGVVKGVPHVRGVITR